MGNHLRKDKRGDKNEPRKFLSTVQNVRSNIANRFTLKRYQVNRTENDDDPVLTRYDTINTEVTDQKKVIVNESTINNLMNIMQEKRTRFPHSCRSRQDLVQFLDKTFNNQLLILENLLKDENAAPSDNTADDLEDNFKALLLNDIMKKVEKGESSKMGDSSALKNTLIACECQPNEKGAGVPSFSTTK